MAKPPWTWPTLLRGFHGAILGAAFGAVAPAVIVLGGAVCWWHASRSSEIDRAYDRHAVLPHIPGLAAIGAILFASAGWATLAPRGTYRFTRTLAIVIAITVPLWCSIWWVVRSMELTPVRSSLRDCSRQSRYCGGGKPGPGIPSLCLRAQRDKNSLSASWSTGFTKCPSKMGGIWSES
jgi:hypothetical protein